MAVYGPRSPTNSDTEGAPAWANTANAYTTNGLYAVHVGDGVGAGGLLLYDYGFSTGGQTITGIKVSIVAHATASKLDLNAALLGDGGEFGGLITYTTPVSFSPGTTDSTIVIGGAGDNWGYAWTSAEVDGAFGVLINSPLATTETIYVDSALITVYTNGSTDPSGGGPLFRRRRSFRGG